MHEVAQFRTAWNPLATVVTVPVTQDLQNSWNLNTDTWYFKKENKPYLN